MIKYHVHIRSKDQFKQVGVREKKMTEMRSKVWNIDTKSVLFNNKYEGKSKNFCLFKLGVLGYINVQK